MNMKSQFHIQRTLSLKKMARLLVTEKGLYRSPGIAKNIQTNNNNRVQIIGRKYTQSSN